MFKRAIPAAVAAIGALAVVATMVLPSGLAAASPKGTPAATAAPALATPTAVTVPPPHPTPDNGGQHCTDGYRGGVGGYTVNHICETIQGSGLTVTGVAYAIQASVFPLTGPAWCGEVEVVALWGNGNSRAWVSPHGCSNSGSTKGLAFTGTIWTYFQFPYAGLIRVYAISDPGRPVYGGYVQVAIS